MKNNFLKQPKQLLLVFLLSFSILGCSNPFKDVDWSTPQEPDGKKRARANAEAGQGLGSGNIFGGGKGGGSAQFEFASSNPLWRASLDTLDNFVFQTIDYSGGVIITDWYSEGNPDEALKITIRFLTDEIRADAINVSLHLKNCDNNNKCLVNKIDSDLSFEIKDKILRKAAKLDTKDKELEVRERVKKKRKPGFKSDIGN